MYGDQLRPIAELDANGNVVSRFVYGPRMNVPEYVIKGGVTYRVFSDHLGSPRMVLNSSTGEVVQRLDFTAFGEVMQDLSPGWLPFGFAAGLFDPDTGLARFGERDYDPAVGRWTSKDPILFEAGDLNIYSYVQADGINLCDPTGLYRFDDFLKDASDFSAGFGDTVTSGFGLFDRSLPELARDALPENCNGNAVLNRSRLLTPLVQRRVTNGALRQRRA